jgi:hypothetical protein
MARRANSQHDRVSAKACDAGQQGTMMASDDWVADVKRWCLSREGLKAALPATPDQTDMQPLGYEAAHPALQSRHWGGAPSSDFSDTL